MIDRYTVFTDEKFSIIVETSESTENSPQKEVNQDQSSSLMQYNQVVIPTIISNNPPTSFYESDLQIAMRLQAEEDNLESQHNQQQQQSNPYAGQQQSSQMQFPVNSVDRQQQLQYEEYTRAHNHRIQQQQQQQRQTQQQPQTRTQQSQDPFLCTIC